MVNYFYVIIFMITLDLVHCTVSVWRTSITEKNNGIFYVFPNYLYENSYVSITMICKSDNKEFQIKVLWMLVEMNCMQDMYNTQPKKQNSLLSILDPKVLDTAPFWQSQYYPKNVNHTTVKFQVSLANHYDCGNEHIITLKDESNAVWYIAQVPYGVKQVNSSMVKVWRIPRVPIYNVTEFGRKVARTWDTGMYHFLMSVLPFTSQFSQKYTATVIVEMRSSFGFLPAINWPLLPYSAVTSFVYLIVGTVWIVIWVKANQHSTKIHVIIGIVTVAGAITNTMVFIEQATLNSTGRGVTGLDWLSQILALIQASLTTMLLMVASTGHGITRPSLHKNIVISIVILTCLRFIVSLAEIIVTDESLKVQYKLPIVSFTVSAIYALFMVIIGAFIMVQSIITSIHLWKRRHSQQIILFSIFMVTCIFSFIVEIVLLGVGYGWFSSCRQDWKHEWIFKNFGSVITVVLLVVLMCLWRPVDIAQSYSFFPLDSVDKDVLEAEEEEDETEIFSQVKNHAAKHDA